MKIIFLLLLTLQSQSVEIDEAKVQKFETEQEQNILFVKGIKEKWAAFIKMNNLPLEQVMALEKAFYRFSKAINDLAEVTSVCYKKSQSFSKEDLKWLDRAVSKFGIDKVKSHKDDFKKAIMSTWARQLRECREDAQKNAIYFEKRYIDLLLPMKDRITEFTNTLLIKEEKKALLLLLASIEEVIKTGKAPVSEFLRLGDQAILIEKFYTTDEEIQEFVNTDAVFNKNFNMNKIIKPLMSKSFLNSKMEK